MRITIHRSKNWLAAQRLTTGAEIHNSIDMDIAPAALSMDAREIALEIGNGDWPSAIRSVGYGQKWPESGGLECCYTGRGSEDIIVNSLTPTPDEVSAALVSAVQRIRDKIAESRRDAEEAALAAARELVAQELAAKDSKIKQLSDKIASLNERITELEDAQGDDE